MRDRNNVPIREAAERLDIPEQGLRLALQQDRFSFGTAIQGKRWRYYINRERFEKYLLGE